MTDDSTTALAFLALDPERRPTICAVTKRTYAWKSEGGAERLEPGLPFTPQVELDEEAPFPLLEHDLDLWPIKLATDVIVKGHAYAQSGRSGHPADVSVQVGSFQRRIALFGDRRVEKVLGRVRFTDPAPFDRIQLSLRKAYGGVDCSVPIPPSGEDWDGWMRAFKQQHPGMYPRNPGGVGYAVNEETLDGLCLPNFEDPHRFLSPEGIAVGRPEDWWKMPLPQGLGWFPPHCYPRSVYVGSVPEFLPPEEGGLVEEVRMGLLSPGQSARAREGELADIFDWRTVSGACPGMSVSGLRGDEPVVLQGLSPTGSLRFVLPGADRPELRMRHRGRELAMVQRLHTLLIEPDEGRFSLVWGGSAPAPEDVPERLPRILSDEDEWDELEGVDITVDGLDVPRWRVPLPKFPRAPWEIP